MFQRRHWRAIAHVLVQFGKHPSYCEEAEKYMLAFAERLADDNPHFERERFLEACGYEPCDI